MKHLCFFILCFFTYYAKAQLYNDSLGKYKIETSAYIEAYYAFDFAKPSNNERANYIFNHRRHNEFNVNHGIIETTINSENIRGHIALMIGTYSQYNLINEQELIRNIYEGNVGFKISKKHNLWIDAGIFGSHIGFESAISKDCWTLSRSILADNTPYYEAGIKATYTSSNEKWTLKGLLLNGWQRIKRLENNSMPSFGTQIQFQPQKGFLFNSSTYIGNEGTDSLRQMRYFHNFYGQFDLSEKWGLITGFDIGWQGNEATKQIRSWNASSVMLRYKLKPQWTICGRGEHYWDRESIFIIPDANNINPNGFRVFAYSLNIDYAPAENMLVRIEAKRLNSPDEVLVMHQKQSNQNFVLIGSMAVVF
jgi:hypothetical protein